MSHSLKSKCWQLLLQKIKWIARGRFIVVGDLGVDWENAARYLNAFGVHYFSEEECTIFHLTRPNPEKPNAKQQQLWDLGLKAKGDQGERWVKQVPELTHEEKDALRDIKANLSKGEVIFRSPNVKHNSARKQLVFVKPGPNDNEPSELPPSEETPLLSFNYDPTTNSLELVVYPEGLSRSKVNNFTVNTNGVTVATKLPRPVTDEVTQCLSQADTRRSQADLKSSHFISVPQPEEKKTTRKTVPRLTNRTTRKAKPRLNNNNNSFNAEEEVVPSLKGPLEQMALYTVFLPPGAPTESTKQQGSKRPLEDSIEPAAYPSKKMRLADKDIPLNSVTNPQVANEARNIILQPPRYHQANTYGVARDPEYSPRC